MERSVLYERINKRVDIMLENGLIDEVRKIFANTIAAKDLRSTTLKFEDEVNV